MEFVQQAEKKRGAKEEKRRRKDERSESSSSKGGTASTVLPVMCFMSPWTAQLCPQLLPGLGCNSSIGLGVFFDG